MAALEIKFQVPYSAKYGPSNNIKYNLSNIKLNDSARDRFDRFCSALYTPNYKSRYNENGDYRSFLEPRHISNDQELIIKVSKCIGNLKKRYSDFISEENAKKQGR